MQSLWSKILASEFFMKRQQITFDERRRLSENDSFVRSVCNFISEFKHEEFSHALTNLPDHTFKRA